MGVTLFLVIASESDDLFLAVVSSPLPSSRFVYPVFFLNPATKNNFRSGVTPWRVSPGAVSPSPLVTPLQDLLNPRNAESVYVLCEGDTEFLRLFPVEETVGPLEQNYGVQRHRHQRPLLSELPIEVRAAPPPPIFVDGAPPAPPIAANVLRF